MGNELERIARASQIVATGRFRRPGKILSKDLLKKEKFGMAHWVWVYNDLLGIGLSLLFLGFFLTLLTNWWSHTSVLVFGWLGVFVSLICLTAAGILTWYRSGEAADGHLSHSERIAVIEGERSRRKAAHAGKRRGRFPEMDFNYSHFSVDVSYEPKKNAIVLRLLEHRPWKDGRYTSKVFRPDTEQITALMEDEIVQESRKTTRASIDAERQFSPNGANLAVVLEQVAEQQAMMESLAEGLEQEAYERKRDKLMVRRAALTFRR